MARSSSQKGGWAAVVVAALAVVMLLVLSTAALADRAPSPDERRAVTRAAAKEIPSSWRGRVALEIRVSTEDRRYALADYLPRPGYEAEVQPASAVLARSGQKWVVVTGPITDGIGCEIPLPVARDLLGPEARTGCRPGVRPRLARVYVTGTGRGGSRSYRPRSLPFGQRSTVTGLRWLRWGSPSAVGIGRLEFNACDPSCAEGRPTYYRVRVVLSQQEICGGLWQYRHFLLRYASAARPVGFSPTYRETFPCP
jgi:hypothetical protein